MFAELTNLHGHAAALATAMLWSFSALAWSFSGRHVGSVAVAAIRILLAALILSAVHRVAVGSFFPTNLPAESFWLLSASGFLGAGLADLCLFRGLVLIGPRLGMLILSLAPILTAILGYILPPHERLGAAAIAGIALTVGGIVVVLSENRPQQAWPTTPAGFRQGVTACLLSAVLVSGGYLTSRLGMIAREPLFGGQRLQAVDPLSGALVRVAAASVLVWVLLPVLGCFGSTLGALRQRKPMAIIVAGTIVGPVIGIVLSMVALAAAQAGIASALISTSPIMMIPIAYFAYGEKPTLRTLAGTLVAVAGIFLLMTR